MPRFSSSCLLLVAVFTSTAFGELIHQYTFNDGTANDSVGIADGVPVNNPIFENGQLIFDPNINDGSNSNPATGQYVDLPNGIAAHRALTVEVWTTFRGGADWQRFVDFGNSTAGEELVPGYTTTIDYDGKGFLILTHNGSDHLLGQISIDSWGNPADTDFSAADVGMSLDEEHHVVFTHDPDSSPSGQQYLYLDGEQVGSDVATVDPSTSTWVNYFIGRSNFRSTAFYNGSINELRLYDHALSRSDVRDNYLSGPQEVPEPTTLAMICGVLGSLGMIAAHRRRRQGVKS